MSDPTKDWKKIHTTVPVHIPTPDGNAIAETIKVKVPAYQNPKDDEIYLAEEALEMLDATKARYMGLLQPEAIKELRERLELTQKQISQLLQIGEKTWTRWETGRDRPSRSMNLLLQAVHDGKVDANYLRLIGNPALRLNPLRATPRDQRRRPFTFTIGTVPVAGLEKNYESVTA